MKHCGHLPSPPSKGMIGPRIMFLSRLVKNTFNEALAEQGLFSGQQHILLMLDSREGITLGEIARALDVSAATASVSVKRMEKAGFITRKADKNDARITRLYLTEKGKTAPENVRNKMLTIESAFRKGMSEDEINLLSELLDKAAESIVREDDTDDKKAI